MQPTFELWDIIHLLAVAQGVFIGWLLLFSKTGNRITNFFLGSLLLAFSYRLFEITAFWTKLDLVVPHFFETSFPLSYLFGVLLFYYVKYLTTNNQKIDRYLWLHLIPFFIITASMFPFYFSSGQNKIDIILEYFHTGNFKSDYMPTWKMFLQFPHVLIYSVAAVVTLNGKVRLIGQNSKSPAKGKLIRIKYLIIGFALCYFLWILSFTGVLDNMVDMRLYDYVSITGMIIFIYTIGYSSFKIPDVHISIHQQVPTKYTNSTLTREQSAFYLERLKELMEKERLFLRQDLSLAHLSEQVRVSPTLISQIINERFGHNFFEFVNQYRVKEAKKLLSDWEYEKYTIASIAFDSGFNNKTSFNNYFKKVTGLTPSEYRNENLLRMRKG